MLKTLRTQHRTIIQMAFNGFKNSEIAERMSMSPTTISTIINSPLGQAYLNGLHDKAQEATLDVRKQLIDMNAKALATFERILQPTTKAPYNVQFNTAKDILDRNGYKPTDKISVDMTLQSKSDEEIDAEIAALAASISSASVANATKTAKQASDELDKATESIQETKELLTKQIKESSAKTSPQQSIHSTTTSIPSAEDSFTFAEASKLHDFTNIDDILMDSDSDRASNFSESTGPKIHPDYLPPK